MKDGIVPYHSPPPDPLNGILTWKLRRAASEATSVVASPFVILDLRPLSRNPASLESDSSSARSRVPRQGFRTFFILAVGHVFYHQCPSNPFCISPFFGSTEIEEERRLFPPLYRPECSYYSGAPCSRKPCWREVFFLVPVRTPGKTFSQ